MDKANKDLIKLIDQILILQRENPGLQIPEREKYRLEKAVHHLLNKLTFNEKTWEDIKPFNPEPLEAIEKRKNEFRKNKEKSLIKKTIELNKEIISETEAIRKINSGLENEIRILVAAHTGTLPARAALKYCTKCKIRFTEGEYEKHIKICNKK